VSANPQNWLDALLASNPLVWLGSLGTAVGAWAVALKTIRTSKFETLRAQNDVDEALRKQMSADVADAFKRRDEEITRLTADALRKDQAIQALRDDVELGWGKARAMEAAFYAFVRHDFGAQQTVNEGLFRSLGWLLEDPVDPDRRVRAQHMLDAQKPYVDPVVPTLAEIEGKRAP